MHPNPAPQASLVEQLGAVADDLRQLQTDFGLRPYRVVSVLQRWSGGRVGAGTVAVVRELELLPTPLIEWAVRRRNTEGGYTEDGSAVLSEISPRLTEEQVQQLVAPGGLGPGEESFLEMRMDARDGVVVPRRRFTVQGPPFRKAGKFEWRVRLVKANPDRDHQGGLGGERTDFPERLRNPLMAEGD